MAFSSIPPRSRLLLLWLIANLLSFGLSTDPLQWTWISGTNQALQNPVYGTYRVAVSLQAVAWCYLYCIYHIFVEKQTRSPIAYCYDLLVARRTQMCSCELYFPAYLCLFASKLLWAHSMSCLLPCRPQQIGPVVVINIVLLLTRKREFGEDYHRLARSCQIADLQMFASSFLWMLFMLSGFLEAMDEIRLAIMTWMVDSRYCHSLPWLFVLLSASFLFRFVGILDTSGYLAVGAWYLTFVMIFEGSSYLIFAPLVCLLVG